MVPNDKSDSSLKVKENFMMGKADMVPIVESIAQEVVCSLSV